LFALSGQRNDVWCQPVYYKVHENSFPSDSAEARGRFVGSTSEDVESHMKFKIITDDTHQLFYRSEVRSALDHQNTNLRIDTIFDGEIAKEFIESIEKAAKDTILQEIEQGGEITSGERDQATPPEPGEPLNSTPENGESLNSSEIKDSPTMQFVPVLMGKRDDGQRHRDKIIEIVETVDKHHFNFSQDEDATKFRVSIDNGNYEDILSFSEVIDHIEKRENDDGEPTWKYKYLGSQWDVTIESENGEISDFPLQIAAAEAPVIHAMYARDNGLLDMPGWKRFKRMAHREKKLIRQGKQVKLRSYRTAPKYMYGYEVTRNYEHALQLDHQNNNNLWQEATKSEMISPDEYDTFSDHGHKDKVGNKPSDGYKKIRVHLVFAVKHDERHKARMVADGHLTNVPIESVYSGVVSLRGLRTVLFLAELNVLESLTMDIGNAYLEAETKEEVYTVAGPEFGDLEGHILAIHKALYGLRTSGKGWGESLGVSLHPCKAEPDIWRDILADVTLLAEPMWMESKSVCSLGNMGSDNFNKRVCVPSTTWGVTTFIKECCLGKIQGTWK
jgi:hypothetical protein